MVRQWVLVPPFGGSNPSSPATKNKKQALGSIFYSSYLRMDSPLGVRPMPGRLRQRRIVYIPHPQPLRNLSSLTRKLKGSLQRWKSLFCAPISFEFLAKTTTFRPPFTEMACRRKNMAHFTDFRPTS